MLRDGRRVVIRPIAPDDKERLAAGYARNSPRSQFRRFLTPVPRLTGATLRYLTEIDHHDHEALIAVDAESGTSLGLARYVREADDPTLAEVAVGVGDEYQRRGLATELLRRIAARARGEGVERFWALVLADNVPALNLIEKVLGPARRTREGDVVRLVVDLR